MASCSLEILDLGVYYQMKLKKALISCMVTVQLFRLKNVPLFSHLCNKNSSEVDIAPAFGEITTVCNVGQAKKGHGACLKSGQLVYARFHTHSHRCCREMYFNSRLDIKFGQSEWSMKCRSTQNFDKVSGA